MSGLDKAQIMRLLRNQSLTTDELKGRLEGIGPECPDDLVGLLNKMRREGTIEGKVSFEKRGWIWWVSKEGSEGAP
jgi:hypothetical protein